MKLAFAKPDYGVEGGFELNLRRIEQELTSRGHSVEWLTVRVADLPQRAFGVPVPPHIWARAPEFFGFVILVDAFHELAPGDVDVVITTQPGTYAVQHPRKLALFYHHHRIYYDLSEVYVRAGFIDDVGDHLTAQQAVREIDAAHLGSVDHILAGSRNIQGRLDRYNGIVDNVSLFQASLPQVLPGAGPSDVADHVLCVSRHEFPKRTELFVQAMKIADELPAVAVGGGGRLGWVHRLDQRLSQGEAAEVPSEELWLSRHVHEEVRPEEVRSNIRYLRGIPAEDLGDLYRRAVCVVAPAYDEDYGHTAMEAMEFGKPVVVCDDGGGLLEMIEHEVTGLVVPPDGRAIAAAVRRLAEDPDLARELGRAGYDRVQRFTWDRAMEQFDHGLERVMS